MNHHSRPNPFHPPLNQQQHQQQNSHHDYSSNHGTCDTTTSTCTCAGGYIGYDCSLSGNAIFNTKGLPENPLAKKFCMVCCNHHALDLCQSHYVTTDSKIYEACFNDKRDQCSSLCEAEIDPEVGPNRQQLSCAATAERTITSIKEDSKMGYPEYSEHQNILNIATGKRVENSAADEKEASSAASERFLAQQSALASAHLRR